MEKTAVPQVANTWGTAQNTILDYSQDVFDKCSQYRHWTFLSCLWSGFGEWQLDCYLAKISRFVCRYIGPPSYGCS